MRKSLMLGALAAVVLGGLSLTTVVSAAPLAMDPLFTAGSSPFVSSEAQVVEVRQYKRRYARPNRYRRGNVYAAPRYRGGDFGNGARGDGGFIGGQQTQGITH
ncbi:MAG: hypothetical protein JWL62_2049 [Hyphomicrobiales bacterium]|nr:hypothetical protein [Hyphomicrobiales bacterium]